MDIRSMLLQEKPPTYVSELPPFGSLPFKCARCPRFWIETRNSLNEKGVIRLEHAPQILAQDCKHVGTSSGCGAYLAFKDIAIPETPPASFRYRWISQLIREGLTLALECSFCHRRREVRPRELKRWIDEHGKGNDMALTEISTRARCTAPDCGRRGAILQWTGPGSAVLPPTGGKRQRTDDEPRGSWRRE